MDWLFNSLSLHTGARRYANWEAMAALKASPPCFVSVTKTTAWLPVSLRVKTTDDTRRHVSLFLYFISNGQKWQTQVISKIRTRTFCISTNINEDTKEEKKRGSARDFFLQRYIHSSLTCPQSWGSCSTTLYNDFLFLYLAARLFLVGWNTLSTLNIMHTHKQRESWYQKQEQRDELMVCVSEKHWWYRRYCVCVCVCGPPAASHRWPHVTPARTHMTSHLCSEKKQQSREITRHNKVKIVSSVCMKVFSYRFDVWSWCDLYTFRDRNRFPRDKWGFVSLLIRHLISLFPSVKTCQKKNIFRCDTKWTFFSVDSKEKEIKKPFFFFVYPDTFLWKFFVKTFLLKTSSFFLNCFKSFKISSDIFTGKKITWRTKMFPWNPFFSEYFCTNENNISLFLEIFL